MPRLLLVQPLYDNRRLDRNARTLSPLGLGYLAAHVPPGWDVAIHDEQMGPVDYRTPVDVVGISTTTLTACRAYDVATRFRDRGVPVILGGVHASACPDEAGRYADAVCLGDGEHVIGAALADAAAGRLQPRYHGYTGTLEDLRRPRHDLLPSGYSFLPVSTSRGCPFDCSFCAINRFYSGAYRTRPVDDVMDELLALPRTHDVVFFTDGNMYGYSPRDARRFKELCGRIADARAAGRLPFRWFTCYGSVNALDDDEALDLAARAGCLAMFVGFESINPASLRDMNKVLNLKYGVDSYRRMVRAAKRRGILVVGEMIVGNDSDDEATLEETARFLDAVDFDLLRLQVLQPLPGTRLFESLEQSGRLHLREFPRDWSRLTEGFLVGVNFDLARVEARVLQRWVRGTGLRFYSPGRITLRGLRNLRLTRSARMAALTVKMNVRSRKTYAGLQA